MRTKPPAILPLFRSEALLRVLGLLLLNEERWWTTDELRQRLGVPAASLHRELHRALGAGLVEREGIGRSFRYRASKTSPLYKPLRELLERTVGIEVELERVLDAVPGVEAAAIYGSFARGTSTRPISDVDVLVLGDADIRDIRRRLRPIERRIGREIDAVVFGVQEFRDLLKRGNSFARDIARSPIKTIIGTAKDFGQK